MGFDISYHPISETEMKEWYFDALVDDNKIASVAKKHGLSNFFHDRYREIIDTARQFESDEQFDDSHAFCLAAVQGLFRTYFYTRGCIFSDLVHDKPEYRRYCKTWQEILGREIEGPVANMIVQNYCGGVYIPAEKVSQLLSDYENDPQVKADLEAVFQAGNITVFLKALHFAQDNQLGLLEATEIVEPNPVEPNGSTCRSDWDNCDPDGVVLYFDNVDYQLNQAMDD